MTSKKAPAGRGEEQGHNTLRMDLGAGKAHVSSVSTFAAFKGQKIRLSECKRERGKSTVLSKERFSSSSCNGYFGTERIEGLNFFLPWF